jgi:hypothetical protein
VRSRAYAAAQEEGLEKRLAKATAAIRELAVRKHGKRRRSEPELVAAAVVDREGVGGLLRAAVRVTATTRPKRGYGGRPGASETTEAVAVEVYRDDEAVAARKREMGWQVYACDDPGLGLAEVVWAYRGQYRIENDWSRLKGRTLGLTPMYLQDEQRMQGLVHILSLCLRVLALLEWVAREGLKATGEVLRGVYPGQAGRKTSTPSAELLLEAMKTIRISVVEVAGQAYVLISPLTDVQTKLLRLWGLPANTYDVVCGNFPKTPPNMSEP